MLYIRVLPHESGLSGVMQRRAGSRELRAKPNSEERGRKPDGLLGSEIGALDSQLSALNCMSPLQPAMSHVACSAGGPRSVVFGTE